MMDSASAPLLTRIPIMYRLCVPNCIPPRKPLNGTGLGRASLDSLGCARAE
jgi:hypothetical protein